MHTANCYSYEDTCSDRERARARDGGWGHGRGGIKKSALRRRGFAGRWTGNYRRFIDIFPLARCDMLILTLLSFVRFTHTWNATEDKESWRES